MSSTLADQNCALVYEPKNPNAGGGRISANKYSCAHGAQINFGDLTLVLTYAEYKPSLGIPTKVFKQSYYDIFALL
jgi:hypothetical protein